MSWHQTGENRSSADGFGRRRNDGESGFKAVDMLQTGKEGGSISRERLVYLTTCLIGHNVEVQVLDGSVYSGIFHATNAEDFGIILKMARLTRDGSRGAKSNLDFFSEAPSKILVIPSEELVQVIAKGVPVTRDGLTPELQADNKQELMTDSCISQSRHVDMQRELERWVPDDDDVPECPELEDIFNGSWNRGWDQFEVNETLFGVKSTFNEELYTTRLEKGPQMRELENEALRIAREIEGEDTSDLHLAEERGIQLHENLEVDEETRFSSVFRRADDNDYDDTEEILLHYRNDETFGGGTFFMDSDKAQLSADATACDPPLVSVKSHDKGSSLGEQPEVEVLSKTQETEQSLNSYTGPSRSSSSNSNIGIAASTSCGPRISPSSPMGSFSSEKSTLNPHAKEFRLNPNARSFSPSLALMRPTSPVSDGSSYYPAHVATVPHIHGMTDGVGPGHAYPAHQPVMVNPRAASTTQAYFPPGGPQMMFGQPPQLVYMPTHPNEMQHKGREY